MNMLLVIRSDPTTTYQTVSLSSYTAQCITVAECRWKIQFLRDKSIIFKWQQSSYNKELNFIYDIMKRWDLRWYVSQRGQLFNALLVSRRHILQVTVASSSFAEKYTAFDPSASRRHAVKITAWRRQTFRLSIANDDDWKDVFDRLPVEHFDSSRVTVVQSLLDSL